MSIYLRILVSTCALVVASPAIAQDNTVAPVIPQAEPSRSTFDVGIEVSGGYTDNLFATRNYEVDDFLLVTRPSLRWSIADGQDLLTIRGEGEVGRHADVKSEDYEDLLVGVDGRLRASRTLTLLGGAPA